MRSYKNKEHFFSKVKKKPAVQAVMDNINDYTEEELENLRGSHFPKWIREALVKYKKRGGKSVEATAFDIAMKMIEAQKNSKDTYSK